MANHTNTNKFPISHVIGFLSSLALTFFAVWVALKTNLTFNTILIIIGGLAIIQASLQLYMFMHMNEGKDGKIQSINIIYAIFTAVVIVAGSIWVMSSGHSHL
ncbi:cytochrome aa3 quinol oxidase subunit IV [Bacillus sp. CGMCC 1.16607]|uniref:cytochrome aa3 quinol oxidase subunit IV n=1 Tax=Bacillus sp. CGMCC 1.16607 TaxID=3351842 RepID=UPI00362EDF83